jgi:hypothetical protein
MTCISCYSIHTSPSAAIRCWDTYKTTDPYLHSGPPKTAVQPHKKTKGLRGGFLGHRSRGGRPRKHATRPGEQRAFNRERKRIWRAGKKARRE